MANTGDMAPNKIHRWRFFRSGGFDQVRLESGADLAALDQLDPKLWAALSCPIRGLEIDGKFGSATRAGVRAMQLKFKLPADGYPTAELLSRMQSGS